MKLLLVGGPLDGRSKDTVIEYEAFVWFDETLRGYERPARVRLPNGRVATGKRALYRCEYTYSTVAGKVACFLFAGYTYGLCCGQYHRVGPEPTKCPSCEAKLCAVM